MTGQQNGPPLEVGPRPGHHPHAEDYDTILNSTPPTSRAEGHRHRNATCGQQVSWWSVHEFVSAVLDQVNDWPMVGTPAWCSLAHDDPAKWAALLDGAQHWALRLEIAQEARASTSRDVSAAADWPALADEIRQRRGVYIARGRP